MHTRALLVLQDQLTELEERLDLIDGYLSKKNIKLVGVDQPKIINILENREGSGEGVPRDINNGTIRDDVGERAIILSQIIAKLQEYGM